jgi:hypothetical protein
VVSVLNEQFTLVEAFPQMKNPPQFILADPNLEVGRGFLAFTGAVAHGLSFSPSFPGFLYHLMASRAAQTHAPAAGKPG